MSDYRVADLVVPKKDSAYIEAFFTKKDNHTYCILPSYKTSFTLKNVSMPSNVSVLGTDKKINMKQKGKDLVVDLANIHPGDISPTGIFVIKLTN
jgi:alpha-L-fucosidase